MNQQPTPIRPAKHSRRGAHETESRRFGHDARTVLCLGLLGSAGVLVLGPNPLVTGIALTILLTCLLVIVFRSLRRASRRIDTILREESETDAERAPDAGAETHRKTA
jgi:hypothetical protein